VLAGATSSFGDARPDHALDDAVAKIGAVLLCRAMLARHDKKFTCWGLTSPMTRADHFRSICSSLPHAAQLTGHLDLCELFGLDASGEWEPFGGPSDPPAVELFDYDDLGIDDDDFG